MRRFLNRKGSGMTEETETIVMPPEQVSAFVPPALRAAIDAYCGRAEEPVEGLEAKEFTEHQKCLTAALAHVDMLLRIASRAEGMEVPAGGDEPGRIRMAALLRQAEDDVAADEKNVPAQ